MNHKRHDGLVWTVAGSGRDPGIRARCRLWERCRGELRGQPGASASRAGSVLHIGWTTEPDNLNPFIGWQNPDYEIWSINYDFLFGFGRTQQPTLDLAREFPTTQNGGISADGKVWTIKLRQGVKWCDGQPLTAADVAFTYNYIVKNKMANMTLSTDGIVSAKALDADDRADRLLLSQGRHGTCLRAHPAYACVGQGLAECGHHQFPEPPPIVGTGPFEVVQFLKGNYVRMVEEPVLLGKRADRGRDPLRDVLEPDLDGVRPKSGALDAAWGIPPAEFPGIKAMTDMTALAYPYYNWEYLNFNCYAKPSSKGDPVLRTGVSARRSTTRSIVTAS